MCLNNKQRHTCIWCHMCLASRMYDVTRGHHDVWHNGTCLMSHVSDVTRVWCHTCEVIHAWHHTRVMSRLRGRVVKGVGHLDHVWGYRVREVVSSIPDRGNIVGWVFHPDQVTGKVFSSAFPSKFWIYLEHCPRGEAVITGHLRLSSMR